MAKILAALIISFCFLSSSAIATVNFEKIKIRLGKQTLIVELADNNERRAQGLMFRKTLSSNRGMLFVFEQEEIESFWMKNTLIPLAIGFFDRNLILIDIQEMQPPVSVLVKEIPRYTSTAPAQLALEVGRGWFKKNAVDIGATLQVLTPAKSEWLKALFKQN